MKDKRIGNDISVVWTLMRDGAPFNISGLPVTLYLRNMYGKTEIEDFTVSKNQVKWTFYGKDQKQTGKYSLVLVVNEDKEGMLTTDACDFVNLVSCSCKVGNGADECGVQTETIELTSTIEYVAGGGSYDDTALWNELENKVDKVEGLGLSEENYTAEEKEKLSGLENYDDSGITGELAKKVNKSDLATINGQRIDEGGNIEIEGGGSTPDLSGYLTKEEFNKASEDFATTDALEGKQDTIEDLNSIRSGAEKGATAVQPSALEDYATTQQLTELSAEVSGLSEKIENLPTAESDVFVAVYGTTTYAEVKAAHESGKVVICNHSGYVFVLTRIMDTELSFVANNVGYIHLLYVTKFDVWWSNYEDVRHELKTLDNGNAQITIAGKTAEVATPQYVDNAIQQNVGGEKEWKCVFDGRMEEGKSSIIYTTYADGTPLKAREAIIEVVNDIKAAADITGYVRIQSTLNKNKCSFGIITYESASVGDGKIMVQDVRIETSEHFFTKAYIAKDMKNAIAHSSGVGEEIGHNPQIFEDIVSIELASNLLLTEAAPLVKIYAR